MWSSSFTGFAVGVGKTVETYYSSLLNGCYHLLRPTHRETEAVYGSGSTPHALIKFSTLFLIVVGYEQVKTVLMHCFIFGEGQRFSHKST